MEFSTSTSMVLHDFVLSVLIVISDIVYKWIPATVTIIFGRPPAFSNVQEGADIIARITGTAAQQATHATQVTLDGTHIDPLGNMTAVPVDGSIQMMQTVVPGTTVSPLTFAADMFSTAWHIFAPLSIFISLLLAMTLVYAMIRFFQVRFAEKQALHALVQPITTTAASSGGVVVPTGPTDAERRWARIQDQIASTEENDWRLAILESDIILGDALTARGYVGDSIGEQLKGLTRGDLVSLDAAWDAHKVRNHIAHRGTMHDINQREARRVIGEFEQVFREFGLL